ncbi:MAG: glycogen/starch synthase [Halobacteria archaeon]|nr:glycogen/starch synthase [Halobacteria archaeon]
MHPDNLIEVSFEIANKVGGIHQVLKSKARKMREYYGSSYVTVGFYNEESFRNEFATRHEAEHDHAEVIRRLDAEGIDCYTGVWNVPGSPRCILVDASEAEIQTDEIKKEMWERHGIDSLGTGGDYDEPLRWGYAVGRLLEELQDALSGTTVVHGHEWMSGPAVLKSSMPTVFTTHATVLGRALSNSDYSLVEAVEEGNVDESLASEYGVKPKHEMEKVTAREADVFTTVSENTGRETQAVLGVEPDMILPNGLDMRDYPHLGDLSYRHQTEKKQVENFLRAYFEPYYNIDVEENPKILFTSGRYEFRNKGLDVLIRALGEVNREEGDEVFVFILVPGDVEQQKMEVLENFSLYRELEDYVDEVMPKIQTTIINSLTSGYDVLERLDEALYEDSSALLSLKRNFRAKENENPPLCAFDLRYPEENDEVLSALRENGLRNRETDRVKVVFYPTYLSVGDRLLSMEYDDFVIASSAGIFPSYYEPWGYTPVETAANGSLSVTTDMSGFGQFILENTDAEEREGIRIIRRRDKSDEEVVLVLADIIEEFVGYSESEIAERKHNSRKIAQLTSWDELGQYYRQAHGMALGEE